MVTHSFCALVTAGSLFFADLAVAQAAEEPAVAAAPASSPEVEEEVESTPSETPAPAPAAAPAAAPAPAPAPAPPSDHHLRYRRGRDMMIAGFTVFGGIYIITAFSGAIVFDQCEPTASYDCGFIGKALILPVVGPFIAASRAEKLSGKMGLVIFPGLGQVTGLALGIAGAALFGSSRKHVARVNGDGVQLVRGREFRLGTMGSARGEGGLQLTYRF